MLSESDNEFIEDNSDDFDSELLKLITHQATYVFLSYLNQEPLDSDEILDSEIVRKFFPFVKSVLFDVSQSSVDVSSKDLIKIIGELGLCLYFLFVNFPNINLDPQFIECHFYPRLIKSTDITYGAIIGVFPGEVEHRITIFVNEEAQFVYAKIEIAFTEQYEEVLIGIPNNPKEIIIKILKESERILESGVPFITLLELIFAAKVHFQIPNRDRLIIKLADELVEEEILIKQIVNNQVIYSLKSVASINPSDDES
jgi:hypothetical protein